MPLVHTFTESFFNYKNKNSIRLVYQQRTAVCAPPLPLILSLKFLLKRKRKKHSNEMKAVPCQLTNFSLPNFFYSKHSFFLINNR